MEFSEKLKSLRMQANFTQEELAEKLIISRQAISNYEQGRGYPSIDILVGMSKLFNVSLDDLLSTGARKKSMKFLIASIGLLFAGSLINLISAYFLRQDGERLLVYVFFSITVYIIPLMEQLVYLLFQVRAPKKINNVYGYRTKSSMTNQLTWDYAQEYFSLLFIKIATILFCLNIPFFVAGLFLTPDAVIITGCVIAGIQVLSLILPVYFVEKKLKVFLPKTSK